jgi:NADH dehydrogenase
MDKEFDVVTGAFGFTGRYIAKELLNAGREVRTLTNSIGREDPFNGRISIYPMNKYKNGNDARNFRLKAAEKFS